jgi:hypothetical protein
MYQLLLLAWMAYYENRKEITSETGRLGRINEARQIEVKTARATYEG